MHFNSERWDIDGLINHSGSDHQRLMAVVGLWRGRANDLEEQRGNAPEVIGTYRQCADELETALRVVLANDHDDEDGGRV